MRMGGIGIKRRKTLKRIVRRKEGVMWDCLLRGRGKGGTVADCRENIEIKDFELGV